MIYKVDQMENLKNVTDLKFSKNLRYFKGQFTNKMLFLKVILIFDLKVSLFLYILINKSIYQTQELSISKIYRNATLKY